MLAWNHYGSAGPPILRTHRSGDATHDRACLVMEVCIGNMCRGPDGESLHVEPRTRLTLDAHGSPHRVLADVIEVSPATTPVAPYLESISESSLGLSGCGHVIITGPRARRSCVPTDLVMPPTIDRAR